MAVYKHLTDANIAKALDRLFNRYQGDWIGESVAVAMTIHRYFPLPEPSQYHVMCQAITKVLRNLAKNGKYEYNGFHYRPIQSHKQEQST